jgi:hypothetical protein
MTAHKSWKRGRTHIPFSGRLHTPMANVMPESLKSIWLLAERKGASGTGK